VLEIQQLTVCYGVISALQGITLRVEQGAIVALIGGNGAGKTTTLRAISGMVKPKAGRIVFEGRPVDGLPPHKLVGLGLAHCPEGRMVFANLTVHENLMMGAFLRRDRAGIAEDFDYVFNVFPRLQERDQQVAGTLSGGEQQMLAIGRALMLRPRLLLLDEPSFGLAPLIVRDILAILQRISQEDGVGILLVEQNAALALDLASEAYLFETGRVVMSGRAAALRADAGIRRAYLGY
jgi:branched-chain amino acid transport system ATP-binding protein